MTIDIQKFDPDLYVPGTEANRSGMTVFLYGGIGTWKTTWAGQWPSPVFLSCGSEGGDDSLAMLPTLTGKPVPPVYRITSMSALAQKVDFITRNYDKAGWKTVVFDSLTFMADMWIAELISARLSNSGKSSKDAAAMMQTRDWGFLENFFVKDLAQTLHRTKLNVIWIALEREISETAPNGDVSVTGRKPMLSGSMKVKIPAMCKLVLHADKTFISDPNNPTRRTVKPIFWTSPSFMTPDVRHKYGNFFPEGKLVDPQHGDWPTFEAINARLGTFIYQ